MISGPNKRTSDFSVTNFICIEFQTYICREHFPWSKKEGGILLEKGLSESILCFDIQTANC